MTKKQGNAIDVESLPPKLRMAWGNIALLEKRFQERLVIRARTHIPYKEDEIKQYQIIIKKLATLRQAILTRMEIISETRRKEIQKLIKGVRSSLDKTLDGLPSKDLRQKDYFLGPIIEDLK